MKAKTKLDIEFDNLISKADKVINANKHLVEDSKTYINFRGKNYDLSEWVSISEYAKLKGYKTISGVSNLLARDKISLDDIIIIPELGNLKTYPFEIINFENGIFRPDQSNKDPRMRSFLYLED